MAAISRPVSSTPDSSKPLDGSQSSITIKPDETKPRIEVKQTGSELVGNDRTIRLAFLRYQAAIHGNVLIISDK